MPQYEVCSATTGLRLQGALFDVFDHAKAAADIWCELHHRKQHLIVNEIKQVYTTKTLDEALGEER